MWDYQEFEREIDGTNYTMYTIRGVEKFTPSPEFKLQSIVCVFQFGKIVTLLIGNMPVGLVDDHPVRTQSGRHPCCDCYCDTARLIIMRDSTVNYICDACYADAWSLFTTGHPTPNPKMCCSRNIIFSDPTCYVVANHRILAHNAKCRHVCTQGDICVSCAHAVLSYRAARMKWMCDRVLEVYLPADVLGIIAMFVLSGVGLRWH